MASQSQLAKMHVGPIHSPVSGRTDHLPMHVPSGSYVIPADIVSAIGEGNTISGFRICNMTFGKQSLTGSETGSDIVAAGGEFVISPQGVARLGGGDEAAGHELLDGFVRDFRAKTINTLKNLPPPKVD